MGAVLTENEELRRMLAESSHKLPLMEAAARVEADRADHAVAEALVGVFSSLEARDLEVCVYPAVPAARLEPRITCAVA